VTKTVDVETEANAEAVYHETEAEAQGSCQLVYIFSNSVFHYPTTSKWTQWNVLLAGKEFRMFIRTEIVLVDRKLSLLAQILFIFKSYLINDTLWEKQ